MTFGLMRWSATSPAAVHPHASLNGHRRTHRNDQTAHGGVAAIP